MLSDAKGYAVGMKHESYRGTKRILAANFHKKDSSAPFPRLRLAP